MPVVLKQTTKQAKAAYKARGRPTLSEKEQRQLARAIELENRAERAKEAEKRRAEAARKRSEKDSRDKADKIQAQLGSQRRCDRFGYRSSQFHLGAFFGKKPAEAPHEDHQQMIELELEEDLFADDELDDNSLLEALDTPAKSKATTEGHKHTVKPESLLMPPPPLPFKTVPQKQEAVPNPRADEDFSDFFDELGSSTQIARELNIDEPEPWDVPDSRAGSFSSGSLDLTVEDLEALDPPKPAVPPPPRPVSANKHKQAMPPPAIPPKSNSNAPSAPKVPAPKRLQNIKKQSPPAIRGPFLPASSLYCSPELGFTLTQLESYVDDEIQLTQALSG